MKRIRLQPAAVTAWLAAWVVSAAHTQSSSQTEQGTSEAPRPSLAASRVEQPVTLDGRLDEPAWSGAEVGSNFVTREPLAGRPAAEPTEFSVVYTADTLYFGIRAFDSDPSGIVAKEMQRDADLGGNDDAIALILDPFHDQRNSVTFEINPNGARTDSLVTDEGKTQNLEWDGVWRAATRITPEGWTAEVAIPFDSLRFDPTASVWGLNVRRVVRRTNEESYWAPIGREVGPPAVSRLFAGNWVSLAGDLTGLEGMKPGKRLNVKPFVLGSLAEEPRARPGDTLDDLDAGLDIKWGVTKSLALDLTYNTDFAQVEVDEQQVNLTRFSLFFPEKREFFLENSGIFDFGPPEPGASQPPLMKGFFSRRIGLLGGQEVPMDVGGRLTGRVGAWSLGVLGVRTDAVQEPGLVAAETDHTVLRVKRDLGRSSSIGMIYTRRDPGRLSTDNVREPTNELAGFDLDFRPSRQQLVYFFAAESDTNDPELEGGEDSEDSMSFGTGYRYTTRNVRAQLDFMEAQRDFDPGLGFLLRRNFRRYRPNVRWEPRLDHRVVRSWTLEGEVDYYERESTGQLESRRLLFAPIGMRTTGDDRFRLALVRDTEQVFEPFEISPGVVIEPGSYSFNSVFLRGFSNRGRRVAWRGNINVGEFYDGDRTGLALVNYLRLSKYLNTELSWNHNDIELSAGNFDATIYGLRINASFSPDLRLNTLLQYNDAAELVGLNVRFNWIYKPGADLFVVYNENWDAPTFSARETQRRELIVKFSYLWQP